MCHPQSVWNEWICTNFNPKKLKIEIWFHGWIQFSIFPKMKIEISTIPLISICTGSGLNQKYTDWGGLAMSTGAQQPSARLCFFTGGLLYFESNSCYFNDAYGRGYTGSRPVRAIGSLWHRHPEGAWKTLPTATLSWLSFILNTLCHLALLSQSLGNRWKKAPGF